MPASILTRAPADVPGGIATLGPWTRRGVVLLLWTIPGLAALSYYYLNTVVTAQPPAWTYALVSTLPWWYTWALLAPVVTALARRFPPGTPWPVLAAVHLPTLAVLLVAHAAVSLVLFRAAGLHDAMNAALFEVHLTSRMHVNALAYAVVLAASFAYGAERRYRARERQAARLEVQLAEARLRALRMQLNPHFLFNTLNAVAALVRKEDNATAVRMLGRLGEFLRLALESRGEQEVPLAQEMDYLERYLEIERVRFGERLTVALHVDPAARDLYVPNLVLQPLVENAVHHGFAPRAEGGRLEVRAAREGDRLVLVVRDDGAGLPSGAPPAFGVGLSNTAARLDALYGADAALELRDPPGGGLEVRLTLPARSTPAYIAPDAAPEGAEDAS